MQVKCQICGKSIDRSIAYKVVVGDANKYFCSEEEFNADKARKDHAKEVLETIAECYQYCSGYGEPPYNVVKKELKENLGAVDVETIYQFVKENREKLKKTIEKKVERDGPFSQVYFAFRYLSAIIKREILERGWKAKQVAPIVQKTGIDLNFYNVNPPKTKQKKRISLEELEDNFDGE